MLLHIHVMLLWLSQMYGSLGPALIVDVVKLGVAINTWFMPTCVHEERTCWHLLTHCDALQVACGSGLERIYDFLKTDEHCCRPDLDMKMEKVTFPTFTCSTQYSSIV
jgi:hypothetical protein